MKRYESKAAVRKDLVKKLAEITGQKPKYSGMPKCEYQLPGFIIDRRGDLLAEDDADAAVITKLMEAGLITDGAALADEEDAETMVETELETTEENTMEIMPETVVENTLETATEIIEEAVQEIGQTDDGEPQEAAELEIDTDAVQTIVNDEAEAAADEVEEVAEIEIAETDAVETNELESGEAQEPDEGADDSETEEAPEITETSKTEETSETDEIAEAEEAAGEDGIDLSQPFCLPLGNHNGVSLRNLINLFYSRGALVGKATGGRFRVSEGLVDALKDDSCTYNMANFRKALRDYEDKNGDSGMEGVGIVEDGILISGFPTAPDLEHYTAWGQLAVLMNNQALMQNRIQAKTVNDENEKYSIRVWMVRLGMNGDSFRQTRKILMKNLSGHAAFRTAEQADAFKKKEKRKRDALKAAKAAVEASGHQVGNRDGDSGELQAENRDAAEAAD